MQEYIDFNGNISDLPLRFSQLLVDNEITIEEYDYLIIDEAQILLNDEYEFILESSLKGGFDKGSFSFFGDFYLQKEVYDAFRDFKSENPENFSKKYDVTRIPLYDNCRNSKNLFNYKNPYDQRKIVLDIITKLLEDGITKDEITILSFVSEKNSDFHFIKLIPENRNNKERILELIDKFLDLDNIIIDEDKLMTELFYKYFSYNKIHFTSVNKFIGMESRAVIITDINDLSKKALLHLGMTRSTDRLFLLKENKN